MTGKSLPGPRHAWRYAARIRRDGPAVVKQLAAEFGPVVGLQVGRRRVVLLNEPAHVKHVFKTGASNYRKSAGSRKVKSLLGDGLLTAEGEQWERHRAIIQPSFTVSALAEMVPAMGSAIDEHCDRWDARALDEPNVDLHAEFMRLTLGVATRLLFTTSLEERAPELRECFGLAFEHTLKRIHSLVDLPPEVFPTPANLRFRSAVQRLDSIVQQIVDDRRAHRSAPRDLLTKLLLARDAELEAGMTDRQIRDELLTLILGGYDTGANALSWAWHLLSRNPEKLVKLREEADSVLVEGGACTAETVARLPYARMVLEEAMRLYPPVWLMAREAIEDDLVDDYRIQARSMVVLSPFVIHRDERYWAEPDAFVPERFAASERHSRNRFAYFPFGAGARQCLGMQMALMEGALVLSKMAYRFDVELGTSEVPYRASITLGPRDGLPARLQRRAATSRRSGAVSVEGDARRVDRTG